jgi:hypothetical protein
MKIFRHLILALAAVIWFQAGTLCVCTVVQQHQHVKRHERPAPLYAELDVSETSFIFTELLSRVDACGVQLLWRDRQLFGSEINKTEMITGPMLLVATGGPTANERQYFQRVPRQQNIVLLHLSDEDVTQTDASVYGTGLRQVFRHYYYAGLGDAALQYLRQTATGTMPMVQWMPLGLANLKPLPAAFKPDFINRQHLWAWSGSTGNKPERTQMLDALRSHSQAAHIMASGFLKHFVGYAGKPGSSPETANPWEYSMLMHQTQFVPIPAGISAEQFRIWEAFETGAMPCLCSSVMYGQSRSAAQ